MLKTACRIVIILLISMTMGVGIFHIVNYAIVHSGISFEEWPETFKWLRHISSLGLIGIFEHALPFVVATAIVVGIERLVILKK
jgi:hypothetical protein